MNDAINFYVFGKLDKLPLSPFTKIVALSATHFHTLEPAVRILNKETAACIYWMTCAASDRVDGKPNYTDGHKEAWKPYSNAASELLEEMRAFAKSEFQ